jgi:hypothetical protein
MDASSLPGVRQIFRQVRCAWENRALVPRLLTILTHDRLGKHSLGILRRVVARGHPLSESLGLSVDQNGRPIPWLTYPFLDFFDDLNTSSWTILEFGSGQSTLYWSARAKKVVSYEHNVAWLKKMQQKVPPGADLRLFTSLEALENLSALPTQPDLVLVDGWERESCVRKCLAVFGTEPFYVLDNSERYTDIRRLFSGSGCTEIRFKGFGPVNNYDWCTSLFVTPQNLAKLESVAVDPTIHGAGKP